MVARSHLTPMERIFLFLRTHPMLLGLGVFVVISGILLTTLALVLNRTGMSLRPVVFLGVFFTIIVGPQIVFHVLRAKGIAPDLTWVAKSASSQAKANRSGVQHAEGRFLHPQVMFGPGYDPDLLSDIRRMFETPGPRAEAAQMAIFRSGESAIAAVFGSADQAASAQRQYAGMLGRPRLPHTLPQGYIDLPRASGDVARVRVVEEFLFVWTGADTVAVERRMQASAGAWRAEQTVEAVEAAAPKVDPRTSFGLKVMLPVGLLLISASILWFFKGSTWAASLSPMRTLAQPISAQALRSRLLAVESGKQPFSVKAGERADEIEVTWKVDAAWLTPLRVSGLRRVHKLVLRLDETSHVVRVREYSRSIDADAGPQGGSLSWRKEQGITFFQVQHERALGLRLDTATGSPLPEAGVGYSFNLQALKKPVIAAVVENGWTWRPILWDGPSWLRWLTE